MKANTRKRASKPCLTDAPKTPRKRIGRLKTAEDVRKYIARCIKSSENHGEVTDCYKKTMMASMLLKAVEVASIEERLTQLEGRKE